MTTDKSLVFDGRLACFRHTDVSKARIRGVDALVCVVCEAQWSVWAHAELESVTADRAGLRAAIAILQADLAEARVVVEDGDLVERLAALSHEQWAGWARWMFDKWGLHHESGESFRDRWQRQMDTPYVDLSESEKESDRIEARKMLAAIGAPERRQEAREP